VIESADFSEPLLAVFASDHRTAIGADSDGVFHLMLKPAEELEAYYAQPATGPTNSLVAARTSLAKTKQP
jgi:hypothetical protein